MKQRSICILLFCIILYAIAQDRASAASPEEYLDFVGSKIKAEGTEQLLFGQIESPDGNGVPVWRSPAAEELVCELPTDTQVLILFEKNGYNCIIALKTWESGWIEERLLTDRYFASDRAITSALGFAAASESVEINEDAFPDPAFRELIQSFDENSDSVLSWDERSRITEIRGADKSIGSLSGIEYLTYLEKLDCSRNSLTELDLNKNCRLMVLRCAQNNLTNLDLSRNTGLTILDCSQNNLTELDLSGLENLTELSCSQNNLPSLEPPSKTELLNCDRCGVEKLDVSSCTELRELSCSMNGLEALDVSACPKLEKLSCGWNSLKMIELRHNPMMEWLYCSGNPIGSLDLRSNIQIKYLNCGNCELEEFLLGSVTKLEHLSLLALPDCPVLTYVSCYSNELTVLDVQGCPSLRWLSCSGNGMAALEISGCEVLSSLNCDENALKNLDISGCPLLRDTFLNGEKRISVLGEVSFSSDQGTLTIDRNTIVVTARLTF